MSKFFCAVALTAVFCLAAGFPVEDDVARQYRGLVDAFANFGLKSNVENYEAEHVKFYLHTKQQPELDYEIKHVDFLHYLKNSTFEVSRPTKIFIHDRLFPESYYKELINAYLRHHPNSLNVITVDYSYFSGVKQKKFVQVYQEIGATVGKFIQVLCDYGVVGDKIHVIGHGVGAHIASVAVRKVPSVKVDRITGLDPTGLEFDADKNLPQLQKHDAIFVDVIVTNANGVGTKEKSRGHVNFFPNGGEIQPRSNMLISHLKSYFYFVESIARGKVFEACVVDGYEAFKTSSCRHAKVINYMGEYVMKNQVGNFYLDTHPVPPYSMSEDTHFHVEETKFGETYLVQVLGTKLAPFCFVPKDDGYYKNAVVKSNTLFKGFGEEDQHNVHVHPGHGDKVFNEVALHYSDEFEH